MKDSEEGKPFRLREQNVHKRSSIGLQRERGKREDWRHRQRLEYRVWKVILRCLCFTRRELGAIEGF